MKIGKEGKRKLKASLANIALFLSVFVVLFPLSMPSVSAAPDITIYVDDSFPGNDPPNHKWTTIGLGVIDAHNETGDVLIRVYAGNYQELVTIGSGASWDNLTLEGNGSDVTTIDA